MLPDGYREWLADHFEGHFHERRGRGKPKDHLVHLAADVAMHYYRHWRKVNDQNGVKDYRVRSKMLGESIRIAIETDAMLQGVDPERVHDLLRRPTSRRK